MKRRQLLQSVGTGLLSLAGFSSLSRSVTAGESEYNIVFEDQESDGESIVLESVSVVSECTLMVQDQVESNNTIFGTETVPADTQEQNFTIELDDPIEETQVIEVWLWDGEVASSDFIMVEQSLIAVDEELNEGLGTTFIEADPEAGFNYPYFLYAPPTSSEQEPRPLVVQPNNSARPSDNFDDHIESAERTLEHSSGRFIADELPAPFLVPVLPRPWGSDVTNPQNLWRKYLKADDSPLARPDLQILAMADDARETLNQSEYPVDEDGIMLNGFSQSGDWVSLFTALHPEEVRSVTAGGVNGMPILPIKEANGYTLDYHVGVANVEELIDRSINVDEFSKVSQFYHMGEFDDSDTLPFFHSNSLFEAAKNVFGEHMTKERFPYAKSVYEHQDFSAIFRVYEAAGHTPRPAEQDLVEFHERSLADNDIEGIRSDLGGNVVDLGAHIEYAPNDPDIGDSVTFDASHSFVEDAEFTEFEWTFSDGEVMQGETVTRAFDRRGGHNISLTGTDSNGTVHREAKQLVFGDIGSDPATGIEFSETPQEGQTQVQVQYTVTQDATDEASLRLRVFGEDGDEITDSPGMIQPGDIDRTDILQLNQELEASQSLFVAILPPGGFNRESAQDAALASATIEIEEGEEFEEVPGTGPTLIDENQNAGFNYPYYLYAPDTTTDATKPLLVEPTNTGTPTDNFTEHLDAGQRTVESGIGRNLADGLSAPFIVPVFPRPRSDPVDGTHYVHALDDTTMAIEDGPLARVDLQLLAMVEDAQERLEVDEYPVDESGIMLNGFSAAGNFVERFTALHPDEVISVTAGGLNGMPILPTTQANERTLDYHVGTANLAEITGSQFDADAFSDVYRFLYMGELDVNDTITYGDAWTDDELRETALDAYGRHMHKERFPYSRAVYDDVGAKSVFRMYEGETHTPQPAVANMHEFHERALAGDSIEQLRADLGGNVPNKHAAVAYAPREAETGDQIAFHAIDTDIRDAEPIEFEWDFGDGTTATGETVTHTFRVPRTHSVTLTVTDDSDDIHQSTEYVIVTGDPIEEPSLEDYDNEQGVIDTDGLRDAIDDWRGGEIDTDLLREVIDYWRSGESIN